jgi:uncharacterized metal-binding protein
MTTVNDHPIESRDHAPPPLIYSCSGCSSAAQLANHLALRMDRAGVAEMSCLAGLGGDVKSLVRTATRAAETGRPIVMLDGCPLQCGRHTLARHGVRPNLHWDLSRLGVAKHKHEDFSPADAARLQPQLAGQIAELSTPAAPEHAAALCLPNRA